MAAADCIFCKIVAGGIPCRRVFENERVLAFLDINPLSEGHAVVIPKTHAERLEDLDSEAVAAVARELGGLGRKIAGVVGAAGYNVLQNNGSVSGQVVPHVHFHIIPRQANDGLGYRWNAKSADADALARLAVQISAAT